MRRMEARMIAGLVALALFGTVLGVVALIETTAARSRRQAEQLAARLRWPVLSVKIAPSTVAFASAMTAAAQAAVEFEAACRSLDATLQKVGTSAADLRDSAP